jgi:hypothetical protein
MGVNTASLDAAIPKYVICGPTGVAVGVGAPGDAVTLLHSQAVAVAIGAVTGAAGVALTLGGGESGGGVVAVAPGDGGAVGTVAVGAIRVGVAGTGVAMVTVTVARLRPPPPSPQASGAMSIPAASTAMDRRSLIHPSMCQRMPTG